MQAVHCMLFWMVLAAPVIALGIGAVAVASKALGYTSGPIIPQEAVPCVAAAAVFWGWVGTLYALLTWAMKAAAAQLNAPDGAEGGCCSVLLSNRCGRPTRSKPCYLGPRDDPMGCFTYLSIVCS